MLTLTEIDHAKQRALEFYQQAGIVLTVTEKDAIEVADFGLSDLGTIGLEVLTYVNTARVCAKELVLFPGQTCPEHRHPTGKEATFRCRWGKVYLYVAGAANATPQLKGLDKYAAHLTVVHEIVLLPGEQYTLMPDTPHWFRGGVGGAVVSEFSTRSTDEADLFTDPAINRFTKVTEGEVGS
jgi:D-lyxose ketol-isomerase